MSNKKTTKKTNQKAETSANIEEQSEEQVEQQTENNPEQDISAELETAQEEIAKLKDSFLRAKAEEDNIRRRAEKEIANSRKFAVEGFAKELLSVRDSLILACGTEVAEGETEAVANIKQGVELTLKQLDSVFEKFSLVEIKPDTGDKLDPNLHQAMSIVESAEVDSGHIISVMQPGYQLHDRLLRPAMVIVSK